jgi:hypothetical protein
METETTGRITKVNVKVRSHTTSVVVHIDSENFMFVNGQSHEEREKKKIKARKRNSESQKNHVV